jgi:hypothetical protein
MFETILNQFLAHFWAWLTGGTAVVLLHRYFLTFAAAMPDLGKDAGYWQRTMFNFVQGMAGNEHRITITRAEETPSVQAIG